MMHLLLAYTVDDGTGVGANGRLDPVPERLTDEAVRCAFAAPGLARDFYPDAGPVQELRLKVEERFLPAWRRRAATCLTDGFWSVEGNCAGRLGQAGPKQEGD
ncbi:MAG: hypothetical protein JSU73_01955 [candidate division WOR-3 bacterium]|nr:MAG: hypothetical protein JSU73_01955 [candidate division WOR-3 bacterium]